MFSYQSTLKQLFQEFETGKESHAQLASVTRQIMQALQTNLDGKSKQYKDPALTNLFLMNNIHYMVRSVRRLVVKLFCFRWPLKSIWRLSTMHDNVIPIYVGYRSEAKDLLGDDWIQRHRRIVEQHAKQYKRIAWAKVLFFQPYAHFKILLISAFSFVGGAWSFSLKFYLVPFSASWLSVW